MKILPFEYDEIKKDIKQYLRNQEIFSDYNFEGSALDILISILAYNTHYLNFYLNSAINELFLDGAQVRKNVVSIAKSLGYIPYRRKPAMFNNINIKIINEDLKNNYNNIIIPKEVKFYSNDLSFININEIILSNENNFSKKITLYQGFFEFLEFQFPFEKYAFQKFIIPYNDIAEYFLEVYVENNERVDLIYNNTNYKKWQQYTSLKDFNKDAELFFVYENENEFIEIYFGDDIISKIPEPNSKILIKIFRTNGKDGNNLNNLDKTSLFVTGIDNFGNQNYFVINPDEYEFELIDENGNQIISLGGDEKETIESIRLNAGKFYASQGRAVNKNDYIAILNNWEKSSLINSISIWGGEETIPPKYGTVFIALDTNVELTETLKNELKEYLKDYNILTITPEIISSKYIYIDLISYINYDKKYFYNDIYTKVENEIDLYFKKELNKFNAVLRFSNLTTKIDEIDGVLNNNTFIQPFIKFQKNETGFYYFNLRNRLKEKSILIKLSNNATIFDEDGVIFYKDLYNFKKIGEVNYKQGFIKFNYDYFIENKIYNFYFDTYFEDIYLYENYIFKLNNKNLILNYD